MTTDIAELSRRLAEHFEPKPSLKPWQFTMTDDHKMSSPQPLWWTWNRDIKDGGGWEPIDCTDPVVSMRLLKWLIEQRGFIAAMQQINEQLLKSFFATSAEYAEALPITIAQAVMSEIERRG